MSSKNPQLIERDKWLYLDVKNCQRPITSRFLPDGVGAQPGTQSGLGLQLDDHVR